MTIHTTDPFATPEPERSPVRRLRGRLPAPVTLWTAPGPAGLTVSSLLVADGDPGRVVGLLDDESELWSAVAATGRFAVFPLTEDEQGLADRFAGLAPAPGGLFTQVTEDWQETGYGPVLADGRTWAGCRVETERSCGWGRLIEGVIETVTVGAEAEPLTHYRGRYRRLPK
ncbi:flavin reductase [Natronosporangium hydrolyticum]|uniref:Flavin reductase n=1 Tax=Natronosporangium hydrolyticum TaxID=2811111 RepID=A0A895YB41_9ACTN|nr:flavin reductase family protein [Natronosporangium hydrolyticum]QSB14967.1 flavin reductase [Natronosporangium hydrolyticum]